MNRLLWIALLGVCTLASCHKHNTPASSGLTGTWMTTVIYDGGFAGTIHNVYPDSLFLLTLNKDSTFEYLRNGRLYSSGTYKVVPYGYFQVMDTTAIVFSNDTLHHLSIRLDKNNLNLKLTCYEIEAAPSSTFIRAK
ncbi:MAG: hypothetical protein JST68_17915 [Bacteroidetes bacterium]|nr:hypothetical protein [Bacteroidota bacterium]